MIEFPFVLLAEDDPDDQTLFCEGMRHIYPHIKVGTFQDGGYLLDYLVRCPPAAYPRCIWLDYNMPRLTAPRVLSATGQGTPFAAIPKVVWSTSRRRSEADECLSLGARRFVIKPVTDTQLYDLLSSLECWLGKPAIR